MKGSCEWNVSIFEILPRFSGTISAGSFQTLRIMVAVISEGVYYIHTYVHTFFFFWCAYLSYKALSLYVCGIRFVRAYSYVYF